MKNKIRKGLFAVIFLTSFCVKSQWQVTSPNGKIRATIQLNGFSYNNYASFSTPMNSPWRVVMIGNSVKTIVESNIVSHVVPQ